MTLGIAPRRGRQRWLALLVASTAFTLVAGTTVLAFNPGPGTGAASPFNAADAKPSPVPCAPTLANLPTPGGSSADYTCTETSGTQSVTVTYFPDTVSGNATDNAWGQGTSSDCFLAKAGGGSPACVTTVYGIGASKTDLQDLGIGLASATVTGGASHDFFYAGIKRLQTSSTNSSNANYSVEINQLLPAYQPADPICDGTVIVGGGCNMWRSPGDITLMTDWGGNSSSCGDPTPAICAYVWIDFASGIGANGATRTPSPPGSTCFNAKAAPCWGILPGGSAKLGDITNSDKAAGSIDAATSTFSEIGVDLNAAGLEAPGQCLIARRFWAHSRASSSFSAELKDFIVANKTVSTCTGTTTSLHETTSAGADISSANNGTSITVKTGAYVTDVATVTPSTSSGTVTFKYYTTSDCSDAGTTAGSGIAISGTPKTASSTPVQFNSSGTFYWRAFFTGGPGSSDSSSTCGDEVLTVRQDTSTSTVLHETNSAGADVSPANNGTSITVNPGAYVTDVASVLPSGATGTMAFVYYTTSDCSDAGTAAGSGIAVVGGSASSTPVQFNSSGTIYWRAFFTGSGLYNDSSSACGGEVLTVRQNTTTSTVLHETNSAGADVNPANNGTSITVNAGAYVTDVASVLPIAATGTVSFKYYTTSDCSDAGTTAGSGLSLTSGSASSTPVQFNSSGTFYWRAFFSASGLFLGSSSACGDEVVTVRQPTTTSTVLHETNSAGADVSPANFGTSITVKVGAYVTDVASVLPSGATGTMAFKYYTTSDCSDAGTAAGSGIAVVGGSASSTPVQFNSTGTFYWRAFFTGSGLYNDSSSACGGEVLTVNQVNTAISTAPWYYPNDKATISAPNGGGNLAGTIVFKLYDNSTNCGLNGATGLLYSEPSQSVSGAGPLDFNTSNTLVKVLTSTTVFWRVEFHSTNPAQIGRNSFCQESINATLTGDSPGTAGNTTP